ncbi:hypothetical protein GW17_00018527 [Ensete ventricosum]|nr:hypothetical protein GW17_00018527 [Ensete ventricosum]RZS09373.1 hypothetical protein BHM03_00040446 [Ensete ventricosum]
MSFVEPAYDFAWLQDPQASDLSWMAPRAALPSYRRQTRALERHVDCHYTRSTVTTLGWLPLCQVDCHGVELVAIAPGRLSTCRLISTCQGDGPWG